MQNNVVRGGVAAGEKNEDLWGKLKGGTESWGKLNKKRGKGLKMHLFGYTLKNSRGGSFGKWLKCTIYTTESTCITLILPENWDLRNYVLSLDVVLQTWKFFLQRILPDHDTVCTHGFK